MFLTHLFNCNDLTYNINDETQYDTHNHIYNNYFDTITDKICKELYRKYLKRISDANYRTRNNLSIKPRRKINYKKNKQKIITRILNNHRKHKI